MNKLIITCLFSTIIFATQKVTIFQYSVSHEYARGLLSEILDTRSALSGAYVLQKKKFKNEGVAVREMKKERSIDVAFLGERSDLKDSYFKIPIPIYKGLLGIRVPVVLKERAAAIRKLLINYDLKTIRSTFNKNWDDYKFLKDFKLVDANSFQEMTDNLKSGKAYYMLRGVIEAPAEVQQLNAGRQKFEVLNGYYVYYPFPIYFYVSKNRPELHDSIKKGFQELINTKNFDIYHYNYFSEKVDFKALQGDSVIKIDNPAVKDPNGIFDLDNVLNLNR